MQLRAVYTDGGNPIYVTVVAFIYRGNDLKIVYIDDEGNIQIVSDESKFTFVEKLG